MRLESALYASREGITAQGQAISVVGDNIANANTVGFKHARPEFADIMPGGPDGTQSTTVGDPGAGVKVGRVRTMTSEAGAMEQTGRALDVGVTGAGFFIVQNGTDQLYTRAGNFSVNAEGLLVDQNGLPVLGYASGSESLSTLNMTGVDAAATPTTLVGLTGNLDAAASIGTPPVAPASYSDITADGAAAFTHSFTAYDSLGAGHTIKVAFTKTASLTWTAQAFVDGGDVTGGTAGVPQLVGTLNGLTFNTAGSIDQANRAAALIQVSGLSYANGATAGSFNVNLGSFTEYSNASIVNGVTNDGQASGTVQSYEIGSDGSIYGTLDTGPRKLIGTLGLRTFLYSDGLERAGNALFSFNAASGANEAGAPGEAGRGTVESGALERSTVDLSDQFVQLVLFQRGYQASSQTLSAASTLLRDTISLIR